MTNVTWKAPVSGDWSTGTKWSNNSPPGINDSAIFAALGNYRVTISSPEVISVANITLNATGAELLDSGSLTIGTLASIVAGTLGLSGGGSIAGGTISLAASTTLISDGNVSISSVLTESLNSSLNLSSGNLTLSGGGSLNGSSSGNGTLSLLGLAANKTFTASGSFLSGIANLAELNANLDINASVTSSASLSCMNSNLIIDGSGGTSVNVTLSGAVSFGSVNGTLGQTNLYSNPAAGTLSTLTTSGTTTIAALSAGNSTGLIVEGVQWVNSGTIIDDSSIGYYAGVPGGVLGTLTNTGTFVSAASGVLPTINPVFINKSAGVIGLANNLELLSGGSLDGSTTGTGTLYLSGLSTNATFAVSTSFLQSIANLAELNANLDINASVTSSASLSCINSNLIIDGSGGTGVNVTLSGAVSFGSVNGTLGQTNLYSNPAAGTLSTLTTSGTITIAALSAGNSTGLIVEGVQWVNSGTIIDDSSIGYYAGVPGGVLGTLTNTGTFVSATSGVLPTINPVFINKSAGVIGLANNLELLSGGSLEGSTTGTASLILSAGGLNDLFTSSSSFLANAGNIAVVSGANTPTFDVSASVSSGVSLSFAGSNFIIDSGGGGTSVNVALSGMVNFGYASVNGSLGGVNLYSSPGTTTLSTLTTSGTTTIASGAGLAIGNIAWLNSGTIMDAATVTNYGSGASYGMITNQGTLGIVGSAAAPISIHPGIVNSGLLSSVSGTAALDSTVSNTGTIWANSNSTLDLSAATLTNLLGGTLTAGTYQADVGATLIFAQAITSDFANIVLSGSGSAIAGSGTTLDDSLSNVGAGGTLALSSGRTFTAAAASGTFTNGGLLSLGSAKFVSSALTISSTGTLSGTGSVAAASLSDGGRISAVGTLALNAALSGTGSLVASGVGSVLDITTTGTKALTEKISGAGTLKLDGAVYKISTSTFSVATTLIDAGSTLNGTATATLGGAIVDNGTLSVSAGTLSAGALSGAGSVQIATAAVLDLTGAGPNTFGGAITGGTFKLDNAAVFTLTGAVPTSTVVVGGGATLDLTAGGTISGSITGSGALQLDGSASFLIAPGATLGVASLSINAGDSVSGSGNIQGFVNDYGTLSSTVASSTLALTGAISDTGLVTASSGAVVAFNGGGTVSGAGAVAGAGTLQLLGTTTFAGGTTLSIANVTIGSGAMLDLSEGGSLTAINGAAGTLQLAGGTAYQLNGSSVGSLVVTASATLAASGTLSGAVSDAGVLSTAASAPLTLTGMLSGAGNLSVTAGSTLTVTSPGAFSGAVLDAGTLVLSETGTFSAGSIAGSLSAGVIQIMSGGVLDVTAAGADSFAGAISGAGTLKLDNAAVFTLSSSAPSCATVINANAVLDLTAGGAISSSIAGAGTLQLDGSTTYVISAGATLGAASLTIASGATLSGNGAIQGIVVDNGMVQIGAGATVAFEGGGNVSGAITGAGTLQLLGTTTFSSTSGLSIATVNIASASTLDLFEGGSLTSINGLGSLKLDGASPYQALAGIAAATVTVDAGTTLSASGTVTGALTVNGSLTINSAGPLTLAGSLGGAGLVSVAASATLNTSSGGAITGTLNDLGTLNVSGGGTLSVGSLASAGGSGPINVGSLSAFDIKSSVGTIFGGVSGQGKLIVDAPNLAFATSGSTLSVGTVVIDSGDAITLNAGQALTSAFSGSGTLKVNGGAYTISSSNPIGVMVAVGSSTTISGSGSLTQSVANSGTLSASSGALSVGGYYHGTGGLNAAIGATVELKYAGSTTIGGSVTGAGTLQIDNGATFGGGAVLSISNVLDTANVMLSTSISNQAGNTFTISAANMKTDTLGSSASETFTNFGSLIASGAGVAAIGSSVTFVNNGSVTVSSGTLSFLGVLSGTGGVNISTSGVLSLGSGSAGQIVNFLSSTGTLDLTGALPNFLGQIANFGASDMIDLTMTGKDTIIFNNSNVGTILNSSGASVATLSFSGGTYNNTNVMASDDGHTGTLLKFTG